VHRPNRARAPHEPAEPLRIRAVLERDGVVFIRGLFSPGFSVRHNKEFTPVPFNFVIQRPHSTAKDIGFLCDENTHLHPLAKAWGN
jgi:hypothetical protein